MTLTYSCSIVSPADLTQSAEWDIRPFFPDNECTTQSPASIEKVGILTLPLVRERGDGKYDFITGRRCFRLLQQNTPGASTWCRVLPFDAQPFTILQLLFEEISAQGKISPVELANFYRLAGIHLSSQENVDRLLTELGLQSSSHHIDRSLELLSLQPETQLMVHRGIIPENVARDLLKLKTEDRETALLLISKLKLGGGKQRRLLSLVKDLCGRASLSFAALLDEEEIRTILQHPQMNIPQKSHALLQYLQRRHTPSLHNAETDFAAWESRIELPEDYTLEHSPAFERDEITLSLSFTNRSHLETCLSELNVLAKKRNTQG